MDAFLENHKLPKLKQEEVENHTYSTKAVPKDRKGWNTSKLVLWGSITLIPKPDKDPTKKEN